MKKKKSLTEKTVAATLKKQGYKVTSFKDKAKIKKKKKKDQDKEPKQG